MDMMGGPMMPGMNMGNNTNINQAESFHMNQPNVANPNPNNTSVNPVTPVSSSQPQSTTNNSGGVSNANAEQPTAQETANQQTPNGNQQSQGQPPQALKFSPELLHVIILVFFNTLCTLILTGSF